LDVSRGDSREETLATQRDSPKLVEKWLIECLPHALVTPGSLRSLRYGAEREVWDCKFEMNGTDTRTILAIFKAGSPESVNTSLPPGPTARKCALAMSELPALGIPTPRVLGCAIGEGEAAIATERIETVAWTPRVRLQAATILAHLHTLEEQALSEPLRELVRVSDLREYRTTGGQGPKTKIRTLVHGDYFSANLLPVADGVYVVDWETFGWGDPMWDLGFLIGADPGLQDGEVEAVIAQYEAGAPVDRQRLMWHRHRWIDYWEQRDGGKGRQTLHCAVDERSASVGPGIG
jgi:Phosphotransferase enzyme family